MEFNYNDGGRSEYFKAKGVGDCVTNDERCVYGYWKEPIKEKD